MTISINKLVFGVIAAALLGPWACTYDPPPEVTLVAPSQKHFVVGEPIYLLFTEPIRSESLEVFVWPGQKDLYTLEKEIKDGVPPLMDSCKVGAACASGKVTLQLDDAGTKAVMTPEVGAFGPDGVPLVLEVTGTLSDLNGRRKNVSAFFDFQIVKDVWDPYADVTEGDVDGTGEGDDLVTEPIGVPEGSFLFVADFTSPIKLCQQFWTDVLADQITGEYVMLLTDADPIKDVPVNTKDPDELIMDTGPEGFIFTIVGKVSKDNTGKLTFKSEPVTLTQTIGPITFELRDMVCVGTIVFDGGKTVWDGTLAVKEVYYEVGGKGTLYPADQANFQFLGLAPGQEPEGMPKICMSDPCSIVGGRCDLLPQWPPEELCQETE